MLRKNWPYLLVLLLVFVFLYRISERASRQAITWKDDYTGRSKVPLGTYVVHDYLDDLAPQGLKDIDKTIYTELTDSSCNGWNYFFVNDDFSPSKEDVKELCRFVSKGNTAFISSRFYGALSDTLHAFTGDPLYYYVHEDSTKTLNQAMQVGNHPIELNFSTPSLHLPENVNYNRTSIGYVFFNVDTAHTTILGTDYRGKPDFIRVHFGKGDFYLHAFPEAFANYYAADSTTSKYVFRALSYLPQRPVIYDEHYKSGRFENTDIRRYMLSDPALHLGYLVVIIAALLALFFGGKRRQRPVPVVTPPANTTLEFIEQVGTLYYRQGNHTDIVHKKINYFLESLRTRFYTRTLEFDTAFIERITNLSGVPHGLVRELFATISILSNAPACSGNDLKKLEKLTWEFNRRSKR